MKAKPVNICLIMVASVWLCRALPRGKDYRPTGSEYVPVESGPGPNTLSKEPTCEELRAMWRFSKRQSRAAEITNEIPTYRDPFAYNVWEEYARPRSAGRGGRYRKPPIYGRVVHSASHLRVAPENSPERIRAFEEVARLFGTRIHPVTGLPRRKTSFRLGGGGSAFHTVHPSQTGSFQHLKDLIRTERARELQEQRLSEEAERVSRVNAGPGSMRMDNTGGPSMAALQGSRVAFPDVLVPPSSKYLGEYRPTQPSSHKYKQRYPDSNSVTGRREWSW